MDQICNKRGSFSKQQTVACMRTVAQVNTLLEAYNTSIGSMITLTSIRFVRRCPVQGSSERESTVLPVYSTICLNIIHHNMVQSSLQILKATCCIQTVTFSFNPKTSSVGCHRVMVLQQVNVATLSTCPLCKDTGYADGVMKAVFRNFYILYFICCQTRIVVGMLCVCVVGSMCTNCDVKNICTLCIMLLCICVCAKIFQQIKEHKHCVLCIHYIFVFVCVYVCLIKHYNGKNYH